MFVTLQGFRECMYVCLLHCRGLGKDDVYIRMCVCFLHGFRER